ncbi:N-acyl homoserine lactonase family protein [Gluconobacter wancherniae]|uniref:N-acyl homoserine lactonase family protein n=1 Tax=Gluconobacter wancherniae TaxID=1307955 RepID=UPI001B8BC604|nr:N-acyl homoserine lactonase family protein [Gluconobacter wancherniae]MBS1089920.1 N-acyl homoserine lactonase family protein [Gluconobacter wancherniae]
MAVERLYVILCGYEVVPKSICVAGGNPNFMLCVPICTYLLKTSLGWVLLDTGFDPRHIAADQDRNRNFDAHGVTPPIIRAGHDLADQLASLGLSRSDIEHVVISHLHYDHSGYIKHLPDAIVHVQKSEYEHAMSCDTFGYMRADYDSDAVRWQFHMGDWSLVDGLDFIATPGHTPGHQSAIVTLAQSGSFILTFDAGDLMENFAREVPPGSAFDTQLALQSIWRIRRLADEGKMQLMLFHDPEQIQQIRLLPAFYD